MIVVSFVLLFLSWEMLSNAAAEAPRYPTQLQEAVFASGSAVAREKSGAAVPIVEKMLEAVKNQTSVANWTASDVLDRLVAELKVAELVTNFVASSVLVDNKTWIDSLFELDRYPGAWEVSLRDNDENAYEGCDNYGLEFMNDAETQIYGFPQFATYCRPTPSEAYERPVYVALNIFKVDVGNSDFGDVSLVVKRDFSLNNTLVAAIDTGFWEQKMQPVAPGRSSRGDRLLHS